LNASRSPLNAWRTGTQVARDLIYDRREFDGDVCTTNPYAFTTLSRK